MSRESDVRPKDMGFESDIEVEDMGYRFTSELSGEASREDPGVTVWTRMAVDEDGAEHRFEWLQQDDEDRTDDQICESEIHSLLSV